MTEHGFMKNHGPALLQALIDHRDKLLAQLAHPGSLVNLEEAMFDPIITRLAAIQGCITAAREAIEGRSAASNLVAGADILTVV